MIVVNERRPVERGIIRSGRTHNDQDYLRLISIVEEVSRPTNILPKKTSGQEGLDIGIVVRTRRPVHYIFPRARRFECFPDDGTELLPIIVIFRPRFDTRRIR